MKPTTTLLSPLFLLLSRLTTPSPLPTTSLHPRKPQTQSCTATDLGLHNAKWTIKIHVACSADPYTGDCASQNQAISAIENLFGDVGAKMSETDAGETKITFTKKIRVGDAGELNKALEGVYTGVDGFNCPDF